MTNMFYQCRLRKGDAEMVNWIEERGARLGLMVQLLPEREYWTVVEVFHPGMDADTMIKQDKLNRNSLSSIKDQK